MHLVVIDMHRGGGHHFAYVRTILKEAERREWTSRIVLSKEATQHPSFELVDDACGRDHQVVVIDGLPVQAAATKEGWMQGQFRRFAEARRAFARACQDGPAPDAVFHPDCDGWYAAAALRGSPTKPVHSVSVAFSIRFHRDHFGVHSEMPGLSRRMQRMFVEGFLRRKAIDTLFVSDQMLLDFYGRRSDSCRRRLHYLPELADIPPLMDKDEARRRLRIPAHADIVLSYGSLSRRKGVQELLQAVCDENCPSRISILLAGEADAPMREFLSGEIAQSLRTQGRLFWEEGFLDDHRTGLVFSAADTAWLGYRDFENSSAFLWQAVCAQMPVIACRDGLIGYWAQNRGLGPVVTTTNVQEVVKALTLVSAGGEERMRWTSNCASESHLHSPGNFGRVVCDALAGVPLRTRKQHLPNDLVRG